MFGVVATPTALEVVVEGLVVVVVKIPTGPSMPMAMSSQLDGI